MKKLLKYSYLLLFTVGVFGLTYALNNDPKTNPKSSFAVVQLFTSQGCSSCPSADRLLEQVKSDYNDENVFVLSYHVDYWNRLGWKDPYSKKSYTDTQYAYGSKFGEGKVYTPQAVINGSKHFVGSNETEMKNSLSKQLAKESKNTVSVSNAVLEDNTITINYEVKGNTENKNLVLALVIDSRVTKVKRGENGGKELVNSNIVIEEFKLPLLEYKMSGKIRMNIPELVENSDELRIVAFVQEKDLTITGASSLKL